MKRFFTLALALVASTIALAQQPSQDRLLDGFARMYANSLQEKVYLMTDKPYYSAGERIWMRGWVVDAVSHTGQTPTNYLYVDLVDAGDNLVQRIKIKRDATGFNNAIDLPSDIKAGSYSLVAYTRWQTNWSEDFFFRRRIEIGNSIDDVVMHEVSYLLGEDSTATALVRFYGFDGPYTGCRVECTEKREGKKDRKFTLRTDSYGQVRVEYTPVEGAVGEIDMYLEVPDRDFTTTLLLPNLENSIYVDFMPEGGDLIADAKQRVAFKAIGADGYSREATGVVCDQSGAVVCPIATTYCGMGSFEMTPKAGTKYYAEFEHNSRKIRFALPDVASEGCALRVEREGDNWLCDLLSTPDFDCSNLGALAHSRGALVYLVDDLSNGFVLPENVLLEGISQVAIYNRATGKIYSERLLFRHPSEQFSAQTKTAVPVTRKRQKVTLDIKIVNDLYSAVSGDYAATVTDKRMVRRQESDENIVTSLLLTSDLGGFIEAPAEYFGAAREHTDLLMMTHGWRRFDIGEVVRDSIALPTVGFEQTQAIEGRVANAFNREPKGAQLVLHNSYTKRFESFLLGDDRQGKFRIEGLDFPDSTTYTISALTNKGQDNVLNVRFTNDRIPFPKSQIFSRLKDGKVEQYIPDEYLNTNKEKYYHDGGMRVIDIEEIVVKAKPLESSVFKGVIPTYELPIAKFAKTHATAWDLATKLHGVFAMPDGTLATREKRGVITMTEVLESDSVEISTVQYVVPLVYVDDLETPLEELLEIPSEDVVSVSFVSSARAGHYGPDEIPQAVIFFKLKPDHLRTYRRNASTSSITPLGYKQAVEFYQPKYEVPNQPDLRTTVAWVPAVQFDEEGHASIEFYTADRVTDYDVVIEGITDDGRPCSVQAVVERSGKA
ncbi:MAG: hypothetical protein IKT94_06295, partial [Rikenellaceae bacterium]|nr:hypothetical protein [Rikenellaceae bacterium]